MKIAGIIAEYNPFHNGHQFHIERTRAKDGGCEATHIVAVMSGNFTQRGEPALLPKRERAAMALAGGADLVLELPAPFAMSSAEKFAFGGVAMLHALGCVDTISFGSECGDIEILDRAATLMDEPRFAAKLRYQLESGISYPKAQQAALREMAGVLAGVLDHPNNTLGIGYLRALKKLNSAITPFTVERRGAEHDSFAPIGTVASASYLRSVIRENRATNAAPYLPASSFALLNGALTDKRCPADPARAERALLWRLRTMSRAEMAHLPDVSEGIENRLYTAAQTATDIESLIEAIKTKRYPRTRIQRLIWSAFAGFCAMPDCPTPPYLSVLAANDKGLEILAAAKRAMAKSGTTLPLLTRSSEADRLTGEAANLWESCCKTDDLYALLLPVPYPCGTTRTDGLQRG